MQHALQESICRILKTQTNVVTENSSLVCGLGTGRGWARAKDYKGILETLQEMRYMFIISTVVIVLQLHTYVKTCEIVQFKYVKFIIVRLHLNKVVKIRINTFD